MDSILYSYDRSFFFINQKFVLKDHPPFGNFYETAKNISIQGSHLSCMLRSLSGDWIQNDMDYESDVFYSNQDGHFIGIELSIDNVLPNGDWIRHASSVVKIRQNIVGCFLEGIWNELTFDEFHTYSCVSQSFFKKNNAILMTLSCMPDIPKCIYQTFSNQESIVGSLNKCQSSWKSFADFDYQFYDDFDCRFFIEKYFDSRVLDAYLKCPLAVMKADLWRYCIIYIYGGIYADIDTFAKIHPDIFLQKNSLLVCTLEFDDMHFCQWIFAAPPRSILLARIIQLSVDRILQARDFSYDHFVHFLTGPAVFTDAILAFLKEMDATLYPHVMDYQRYKNYILHVFDPHIFHNRMVIHHFHGKDHWQKEKKEYIQSSTQRSVR